VVQSTRFERVTSTAAASGYVAEAIGRRKIAETDDALIAEDEAVTVDTEAPPLAA